MPNRSKVATHGYADQVKTWLEQGMTEEAIAARLNVNEATKKDERVEFNHVDIHRFKTSVLKRTRRPEQRIARVWDKDATDALTLVQTLLDAALGHPVDRSWDRDTRETILAKVKLAREKLELLGYYPKAGVQVAVGVKNETNVTLTEEAIEEAMRRILHQKPSSTETGGKPADTENPTPTN